MKDREKTGHIIAHLLADMVRLDFPDQFAEQVRQHEKRIAHGGRLELSVKIDLRHYPADRDDKSMPRWIGGKTVTAMHGDVEIDSKAFE